MSGIMKAPFYGASASPELMAKLIESSGLDLSKAQVRKLWEYHRLLREHNPQLNLTRIHNFTNMVLKLYVDSILPATFLNIPSPLMDIGTGPGMPGIPLKIFCPQIELIMAESRQKRVDFLKTAVSQLKLRGVKIVGESITKTFSEPVGAVITRALETIPETLNRISGCLMEGGMAIFMKGPNCDDEIQQALKHFGKSHRLLEDRPYRIPGTPHNRRLIVFERLDQPTWIGKERAMSRHRVRKIESEQNDVFRSLKKLLGSRGIRKASKALLAGSRQIEEILRDFPERCETWVSPSDLEAPPSHSPEHLDWYQVEPQLFKKLDQFGTNHPLLVVRIQPIPKWNPSDGLLAGCTVMIPFQDPENVGAAIRSSVALGAENIILLAESAHPYHPKALRASGGAVFHAELRDGPSLFDLPENLPILALSKEGVNVAHFSFPETFALLAGMEGPGIPAHLKVQKLAIPIGSRVESLNAAAALAIALYEWARRRK